MCEFRAIEMEPGKITIFKTAMVELAITLRQWV